MNRARDVRKRNDIYETARLKHTDVLFLQETHSDQQNEIWWSREWKQVVFLSHHIAVSVGVAILLSRAFTPASLRASHVVPRRCLLSEAGFNGFNVFMNIYAPNDGAER